MVNKRGWLRIVEATIAIMLILGAVLVVVQNRNFVSQKDLTEDTKALINEIAKNTSLREKTLRYDISMPTGHANQEILLELNEFVRNRIGRANINSSVVICGSGEFCNLDSWPAKATEVYSSDRIISSDVLSSEFEPKKLKIYLWRI